MRPRIALCTALLTLAAGACAQKLSPAEVVVDFQRLGTAIGG